MRKKVRRLGLGVGFLGEKRATTTGGTPSDGCPVQRGNTPQSLCFLLSLNLEGRTGIQATPEI